MDREEPYTDEELAEAIRRGNDLIYELKEKQMKTATIESCTFKSTWTTKRGDTMYTHTLKLSNGESGDINAKSQNPDFLQEGETLNYASTQGKFGLQFTRIKPQDPDTPSHGAFKAGQNWNDPEREKKIIRQSSLGHAVNFFSGKNATDTQIITLAEKFEAWVNR